VAELGPHVLAVRLDSDGDVLLTSPALRCLRAGAGVLDLLVSPAGAHAAHLLPGVDEVLVAAVPWTGRPPPEADPATLGRLLSVLHERRYDEAVVFTSFHQSPLPFALLAKWAGIPTVAGTSDAYPGSLLDQRHRRMPGGGDDVGRGGGHEVEAMLALAEAAGYPRPVGDDGRLRIKPVPAWAGPDRPYVVVHPGACAPSRAIGARQARAFAARLLDDGWEVVVTGGPGERDLGTVATPPGARNVAGRTTLPELAAVLAGARAVVVGNTGPAHLAAAVGTPVVSLFAPVVPAERWAPWGVEHVLLGDQHARCRDTRAVACPVPRHPCLSRITPDDVAGAVRRLTGRPVETTPLARQLPEVAR
jgi:ADP-heptose:LPS heptosyltransferase